MMVDIDGGGLVFTKAMAILTNIFSKFIKTLEIFIPKF